MFVLAITACPTGIAHTYIAADKLKKAAKKLGVDIKVETQGTLGISNEIAMDEVKIADAIIIASDISISKMERFNSKKFFKCPLSNVVKNPEDVIKKALEM